MQHEAWKFNFLPCRTNLKFWQLLKSALGSTRPRQGFGGGNNGGGDSGGGSNDGGGDDGGENGGTAGIEGQGGRLG
eukprot:6210374-Pleurochrysis_carterae.AAC.1